MTNNIADISIFEQLQNEAHQLMGFSSLSVFNATFKIVDKKKAKENADKIEKRKLDFEREEKFLKETKDNYKKKKETFDKLEKSGLTTGQEYIRARNELGEICSKRILSRSNLKRGIKEVQEWGVEATSTELKDDD